MARNVFFAFLGMSDYTPLRYALGERVSVRPEKFVQAALLDLLELPSPTVRIGVTPEVMAQAWPELKHRLSSLTQEIEEIPIKVASSETSLWEQFTELGKVFAPDDTVYFDLTHGFRSLSAMALLSIAYFQRLRGFRIGGVYYGAFEALLNTPIPEAEGRVFQRGPDLRAWQEEKGVHLTAPIFDLTGMFALPAWADGFSTWERTGRAEALVALTKPYLDTLARSAKRDRPVALCNLPARLQLASDALTLVHHAKIGPLAADVVRIIDDARAQSKDHPSLSPLEEILDGLSADLREIAAAPPVFTEDGVPELLHQISIARWLRRHSRLAESLSIVRELAGSCAVQIARCACVRSVSYRGIEVDSTHRGYREKVDGWMMFLSGYQLGTPSDAEEPAYQGLARWLDEHVKIRLLYREALQRIHLARNKTLHAFTGEHSNDDVGVNTLAGRWTAVDEATGALDELVEAIRLASTGGRPSRCFLNLSNHPVATWSEAQREAAVVLGFGDPIDIDGGMPLADPSADTDAVSVFAENLATRASLLGAKGAFVATDLTLTVALVGELRARGVRCFASTTERVATSAPAEDGAVARASTFRFVRWREYP